MFAWALICEIQNVCFIFSLQALGFVGGDVSFSDDDLKLVQSLRVLCWLNGAACSLKLKDFQQAVRLCSEVSIKARDFFLLF